MKQNREVLECHRRVLRDMVFSIRRSGVIWSSDREEMRFQAMLRRVAIKAIREEAKRWE